MEFDSAKSVAPAVFLLYSVLVYSLYFVFALSGEATALPVTGSYVFSIRILMRCTVSLAQNNTHFWVVTHD